MFKGLFIQSTGNFKVSSMCKICLSKVTGIVMVSSMCKICLSKNKSRGFSGSQRSDNGSHHEMEWEAVGDLDDINMIQRMCLSEEMDWTPQMGPVDEVTRSLQSLCLAPQEEQMDWMPEDASCGLVESFQGLSLGAVEEEMEADE
ncbi:hypothetical protein AALO_G00103480 [Alosa alosa]|uniref:Uncharacterized protein n=1 Tax=Alosa alosa TaxID=278164 RepID=A0AAV6GZS0_9TELE|nr:hypothetical protein AALO_G00103480 [Alosa alosa]